MKQLNDWLSQANPEEQNNLSRRGRTSLAYIKHLANGFRRCSAKIAANLERATTEINRYNDKLPVIPRGELNETCRTCPYYKHQCKGDK